MPLRILLADDHRIVRQGFRAVLEQEGFDVVGEAANGEEAIRLARAAAPDVAVLDLMMPVLNGLDATREMVRVSPATRVILLSMHAEEHQIVMALKAGARGYLVKTQAAEDLVQAIRDVMDGDIYLSPRVSRVFIEGYLTRTDPLVDPLTPRERHVVQLVAEGRTSKDIASMLGLTVRTVESYRNQIMEKLDIHDTAGLVRYAVRRGLVQP